MISELKALIQFSHMTVRQLAVPLVLHQQSRFRRRRPSDGPDLGTADLREAILSGTRLNGACLKLADEAPIVPLRDHLTRRWHPNRAGKEFLLIPSLDRSVQIDALTTEQSQKLAP